MTPDQWIPLLGNSGLAVALVAFFVWRDNKERETNAQRMAAIEANALDREKKRDLELAEMRGFIQGKLLDVAGGYHKNLTESNIVVREATTALERVAELSEAIDHLTKATTEAISVAREQISVTHKFEDLLRDLSRDRKVMLESGILQTGRDKETKPKAPDSVHEE